jgi:threonylcarbamoyladenosine tRNA methylthiotransferase MtaB
MRHQVSQLKVSISTLGCKSNQYDSSALEDALRHASLSVVPFPGPADAYIINTCTVTGSTDHQSRQLIRKVRRENPGALVIVTGCYAQVSPEEVASIEGVDYVVGNPEKGRIAEYIKNGRQASPVKELGRWQEGTPWSLRALSSSGRTRANFKIQEGCSRACSYCIIPQARGLSRSLPIKEVESELDSLVASGYREIVLTGIHLGAYGSDFDKPTDLTAVLELVEKKDYPCRFRISSVDPDEVTDRLIEILKSAKRVCNHLHLPLQSGDDTIIRRMHRPYTGSLFAEKVEKLAASVPGISIGADIIAGFPGEGEKEFGETFSLVSGLPLSYLHIFPFSARRGTPAATMDGQVEKRVIRERCDKLHELDSKMRESFHRSFVGKEECVLVEFGRHRKTGLMKGRTRNYIQVFLDGEDSLRGSLAKVQLTSLFEDGMKAEALGPQNPQEAF